MSVSTVEEFNHFLNAEKTAFGERFQMKIVSNKTIKDFSSSKVLGIGTYGRVILAKENVTKRYFAIKILSKKSTVETNQVEHCFNEKRILQSVHFNFITSLYSFFMDNNYLYFVMPFVSGGELFRWFHVEGPFTEVQLKFYAAQIILALQYLHNVNVIYRDLKPENVLIDAKGYIKITDFGLSKVLNGRTYTICGTPDYIAPEIILSKGYGLTVDFWALGVLLFELHTGYPPFFAPTLEKLYDAITKAKYKIPGGVNKDLTSLLKGLITDDLTRRLGNMKNGIEDIKNHAWFQEINWIGLLNYKQKAPFIPEKTKPESSPYFDPYLEPVVLEVSSHDSYEFQFYNF